MHPTNNTHLFIHNEGLLSTGGIWLFNCNLPCWDAAVSVWPLGWLPPGRPGRCHTTGTRVPKMKPFPLLWVALDGASFQVRFKLILTPCLGLPWRVTHQCSEPTASHKETFSKTGAENTMPSPIPLAQTQMQGSRKLNRRLEPYAPQDVRR